MTHVFERITGVIFIELNNLQIEFGPVTNILDRARALYRSRKHARSDELQSARAFIFTYPLVIPRAIRTAEVIDAGSNEVRQK